ncbi:MAG: hypothetical protein GC199_07865 [Alphaproteobacteria bacterium]|nr:hypothetical protein [Alphaproteobacteria bacterium]
MEAVQDALNNALAFLQSGFREVNALQGLLIAIGAAFLLKSYGRIWMVSLGAVLVHVMLDVMVPVLANKASFHLPPLVEPAYWRYLGALFVGYLIVISLFWLIKRNVLQTN